MGSIVQRVGPLDHEVRPNEAFAAEADQLRWLAGGPDALDEAFRNRIACKVANDATVRVDHVLYDVPMGLIGEKVELRYPGRDDDVDGCAPAYGGRRRIAPTDKAANADAPAKPAYAIDYAAIGE